MIFPFCVEVESLEFWEEGVLFFLPRGMYVDTWKQNSIAWEIWNLVDISSKSVLAVKS